MSRAARLLLPALFLVLAAGSAARADEHIFSYDASSPPARALAETGLSFQFQKLPLGAVRLERIIQTGETGFADIRPSNDGELGPGGLRAALGGSAPVGALYEIKPDGDGQAFVGAVCPGAERAWLVIGPLRRFKDLPIQVVGRDAGAKAARHCADLVFSFHSEWSLPPDRAAPKPLFADRRFR
jgi:hypothetical protein